MSRSNPTEQLKNPAFPFFEWDGVDGGFSYYDKETKTDIQVPYPFTFMVLDILYTVKGYHKPSKTGYYSNEIRIQNYETDKFVVKSKAGVEFSGTWNEISAAASKVGCKLYHSVYVAYKSPSGLVLSNIKLKGGAKTELKNFGKENDIWKIAITVKSHKMIDGVSSPYAVPVFTAIPEKSTTEESKNAAIELDKKLQEYLKVYFANKGNEQTIEQAVENTNHPQEQVKEQPKTEPVSENVDDVNVEDLPF